MAEQKQDENEGFFDADACMKTLKANAAALLERCDLVSRREFDVQKRLLEQAMDKLESVETRLVESGRVPDEGDEN